MKIRPLEAELFHVARMIHGRNEGCDRQADTRLERTRDRQAERLKDGQTDTHRHDEIY